MYDSKDSLTLEASAERNYEGNVEHSIKYGRN